MVVTKVWLDLKGSLKWSHRGTETQTLCDRTQMRKLPNLTSGAVNGSYHGFGGTGCEKGWRIGKGNAGQRVQSLSKMRGISFTKSFHCTGITASVSMHLLLL